jgi:hypothetical protein
MKTSASELIRQLLAGAIVLADSAPAAEELRAIYIELYHSEPKGPYTCAYNSALFSLRSVLATLNRRDLVVRVSLLLPKDITDLDSGS